MSWRDKFRDATRRASGAPESSTADTTEEVMIPIPDSVRIDGPALLADPKLPAGRGVVAQVNREHRWVVAVWYSVDPLAIKDGRLERLELDDVLATLPPACYFCEASWSFAMSRRSCPGKPYVPVGA